MKKPVWWHDRVEALRQLNWDLQEQMGNLICDFDGATDRLEASDGLVDDLIILKALVDQVERNLNTLKSAFDR